MSRSKKKTPICGMTTAQSDKPYKKIRAGTERAKERALTQKAILGDESATESLEVENAPFNDWAGEKDGKQWFGHMDESEYKKKLLRK